MKITPVLPSFGIAIALVTMGACQRGDKSKGEAVNNSTGQGAGQSSSYVLQSAGDLPACDDAHLGQLAYVKDETKFYTCVAPTMTWETIEIKGEQGPQGPSGTSGISVFRADGVKVGKLVMSNSEQNVAILLKDGAIGWFETAEGRFVGGLCAADEDGYDSGCVTDTLGSTYNCSFAGGSCSGDCYFFRAPIPNSIFKRDAGNYVRANGNETTVTRALTHTWNGRTDVCDVLTASNYSVYRIPAGSQSYTFPAGLTQPLSPDGSLYFGE